MEGSVSGSTSELAAAVLSEKVSVPEMFLEFCFDLRVKNNNEITIAGLLFMHEGVLAGHHASSHREESSAAS
jgi:hypothetical protein